MNSGVGRILPLEEKAAGSPLPSALVVGRVAGILNTLQNDKRPPEIVVL